MSRESAPKPGEVWQHRTHVTGRRVRIVSVDNPDAAGARALVEPVAGFGRRSRILVTALAQQWARVDAEVTP